MYLFIGANGWPTLARPSLRWEMSPSALRFRSLAWKRSRLERLMCHLEAGLIIGASSSSPLHVAWQADWHR